MSRAGESIEDFCRACKTDRMHTVIAAGASGTPLRVACGYCRSEHNYRGGPRIPTGGSPGRHPPAASVSSREVRDERPRAVVARGSFPLVTNRERSAPPMPLDDQKVEDFELLLRRVIREETGLTPAAPVEKWRGGSLVLKPGTPGLQEKSWPIETFFHKIVMLRNRLRTLEQQLNASSLADDEKVRLQSYITGCYGSLTSFNVLFADTGDHFKGSAGGE